MSGLPGLCSSQRSLDSCSLALSLLITVLIQTDVIRIMFNKKLCMKLRISQTPTLEDYGSLPSYWPVSELTSNEKSFKNVCWNFPLKWQFLRHLSLFHITEDKCMFYKTFRNSFHCKQKKIMSSVLRIA